MTGPELWGQAEILERFNVASPTLVRWIAGRDFPGPIAELRMGRVWDADEVREWHAGRTGTRLAVLTEDSHAQD